MDKLYKITTECCIEYVVAKDIKTAIDNCGYKSDAINTVEYVSPCRVVK